MTINACISLQMCGIGSIDVKDWKQNTVYKGDYHPNHIVIQWFWRVVLSFNNELRSRLLQVCSWYLSRIIEY